VSEELSIRDVLGQELLHVHEYRVAKTKQSHFQPDIFGRLGTDVSEELSIRDVLRLELFDADGYRVTRRKQSHSQPDIFGRLRTDVSEELSIRDWFGQQRLHIDESRQIKMRGPRLKTKKL
jgi:hypothetical protein